MSATTRDRKAEKRATGNSTPSTKERLPDSIDSFSKRAIEMTSVLENILHKECPPKNLPGMPFARTSAH